jgi:iron complex outermembrane recepter protein
MAFSNIDAVTLKKQNLGQDAPFMLNRLPNVVVNSDAGNGVGYTGLRIRGTDGTRINVTINGVPVNDAESQGTFFVDMPDLVSSVNNIQVQRGVGTSNNGAGAFGASVNFQTNQLNEKPYANIISTAGSYDTYRNTIAAGTGLLNEHFTFDARASRITSNGYVDRASSLLNSYYLSGGYYGKRSVIKIINFSGYEKTYQAWNYVPEDSVKKGRRTYNEIGAYDDNGTVKYYKNETDNYTQNNSQLHYILKVNRNVNLSVTGHYTKGKGYYEQYKQQHALADYGMKDVITPKDDTIMYSDIVRRLWLDNDFAGGLFNLNVTPAEKLSFTLGGGYNTYYGRHYGRVMWAQFAQGTLPDHQYYFNTANKNDGNIYLKTNYRILPQMNIFIDLQGRNVSYRFLGVNDSLKEQLQDQSYNFFNPKAGLSYDVNQNLNIYASVAVAHKEPNRDDFVQNRPSQRPRPEELTDIEAGASYVSNRFRTSLNFYNMEYFNQLVVNGQVNYVGAAVRTNVGSSYRRGVEFEIDWKPVDLFGVGGNVSLSENKIRSYSEFIDSSYYSGSDYVFNQRKNLYKNTDIALSPAIVSSAYITLIPVKNLELSLINKHVGRQYLDNTTNVKRSINPYNVFDLNINYTLKTRLIPEITFIFAAYNLLSAKYETTGYTYSYYYDGALNTFNYLAPAAPLNFMGGINVRF